MPTLVEGPIDGTVRCQDEALPCSYLELNELHESDGPIPAALGMTTDELAALVAQLDELSAFAEAHRVGAARRGNAAATPAPAPSITPLRQPVGGDTA